MMVCTTGMRGGLRACRKTAAPLMAVCVFVSGGCLFESETAAALAGAAEACTASNSGAWADPNHCMGQGTCAAPAGVRLGLSAVHSVSIPDDDNPEIVRMIPGSMSRAVFVAAAARKISLVTYGESSFEITQTLTIPGATESSEFTSVDVDPSGTYVAVTRAELDCALGYVALVDLDANPGALLAEVQVGYNPDSVAFSPDGQWLVVANEDDREDRPCKPSSRHGGSITVIDLQNGPAGATVAQTIAVDHDADSEPEGVKVAPNADTVVVSIQETSEYGIFSLADVPSATLAVHALPESSEPDGIAIAKDSSFAVIGNEKSDSFSIVSLPSGTLTTTYDIHAAGDVPEAYNRDDRKSTKHHEPEELVVLQQGGADFVLIALQESHAVISYNLTDLTAPAFDSIAPAGMAWEDEEFGREKSDIGPEGLDANVYNGVVFSANEREGTVTMYKNSFSQMCP